jgi:Fe-S oxidoreductase
MSHDRELLERLGVDYEILDTGCCGMAGSFGYHAGEHYDVSVGVWEHSLEPALAGTPEGTIVVADGFSCRGQIEQLGGREALHVANAAEPIRCRVCAAGSAVHSRHLCLMVLR